MDELRLIHVAEDRFDLAGGAAHDPARLLGGVVREAARHLAAVGIDDADDFAALELARYLDDADRQQALAVARERPGCAGVQALERGANPLSAAPSTKGVSGSSPAF